MQFGEVFAQVSLERYLLLPQAEINICQCLAKQVIYANLHSSVHALLEHRTDSRGYVTRPSSFASNTLQGSPCLIKVRRRSIEPVLGSIGVGNNCRNWL